MRNNRHSFKASIFLAIFLQVFANFSASFAQADTPPPGTVKAKLHDGAGQPISSTSGAINAKVVSSTSDPVFNALVFGGSSIDPRDIRALTAADVLSCKQDGPWSVSISGALALPTGAATEATLATVAKETGGNLESIADSAADISSAVQSLNSKVTAVNTGAVVVSSSALPAGAATQATLATRASEATLATRASEATLSTATTKLTSIDNKITTTVDGIKVDVGGATFTASSDLNDGAGNPITSTVDGAKRRLDVDIDSPVSIEGGNAAAVKVDGSAVTQPVSAASLPLPTGAATQSTLAAINTKITTTANGIAVDNSGVTQPVSVATLPLPTGAATEATLASRATEATQQVVRDRVVDVNNKLNTLGQKTMAGSVPVTVASDQGPIAVNGTVAVTGVATEATLSGLNAKIKAYDVDTSGVTENVQGVTIRLPGASGSTSGGTAAAPLRIDPTGTTTQPVSVVAGTISLPSGSATEAKQDAGNASLAAIDADIDTTLSSRASESTLATVNAKVPSGLTVNVNKLLVDNSGQTQPISAAALPLPSGAATAANQTTGNNSLSAINAKITAVDTGNVTVSASALPTGAATEATLATRASEATLATRASEATLATRASESTVSALNGKILSVDLDSGAGNQAAQGVNLRFAGSGGSVEAGTASSPLRIDPTGATTQPVSVSSSALPSGAATEATLATRASEATLATRASEATLSALDAKVTAVDTGNVTVSASALPAGAATAAKQDTGNASLSSIDTKVATAAKQDTGNGSLASIDGKLNSLGQKASNASVPVVIAGDQSAIPATQSGTWNITNVSGTVSLPTGAATAAKQDTGNASLASIDTKTIKSDTDNVTIVGSTLPSGAATEATLATRASEATLAALNGKVTTVDTGNVVVSSSALPSGAATAARQDTGNASAASIDSKLGTLGQKLATGSAPVVIASDQSAIPSSQSGTWNINNVSGTVSLPTGAATAANQSTANTSLSAIQSSTASLDTKADVNLSTRASESTVSALNAKFSSLGQKTMANSAPVVISSDQSALPASQSGTWSTRTQDGAGNALTSTVVGSTRSLDANVSKSVTADDISTTGSITTACATPTAACAGTAAIVMPINGVASTEVQITGTFSGASLNVDGTADGTNWIMLLTATGGSGLFSTTAISAAGKYKVMRPAGLKQLRVRASALASGTVGVVMNASSGVAIAEVVQLNPLNAQTQINAENSGAAVKVQADATGNLNVVGNVAAGATDSGNPVKMGGKYNSTAPVLTDGQRGDMQVDRNGRQKINTGGDSFSNITAAGTSTLRSGAGRLIAVCVNTNGGNGNTLTMYDNTTGTGTTIGQITTSGGTVPGNCGRYDLPFATGLTAVTTGTSNWTVIYQ